MIRAQLVRGAGISSSLIAWQGSGIYSHADIVLPDGRLLGARSDAVGGQPPGVRVRPAFYETWKHRTLFALDATPEQEKLFYDFALAQEGKPYDSRAIVAFLVNRNWRDTAAWFCSELVAASLEHSGRCPHLFTTAQKVTPVGLAMVLSALGAEVLFDG